MYTVDYSEISDTKCNLLVCDILGETVSNYGLTAAS